MFKTFWKLVPAALLAGIVNLAAEAQQTAPQAGLRENPSRVHALENARIYVRPDLVIEKGVVVIRDGLIVEAGGLRRHPAGCPTVGLLRPDDLSRIDRDVHAGRTAGRRKGPVLGIYPLEPRRPPGAFRRRSVPRQRD